MGSTNGSVARHVPLSPSFVVGVLDFRGGEGLPGAGSRQSSVGLYTLVCAVVRSLLDFGTIVDLDTVAKCWICALWDSNLHCGYLCARNIFLLWNTCSEYYG